MFYNEINTDKKFNSWKERYAKYLRRLELDSQTDTLEFKDTSHDIGLATSVVLKSDESVITTIECGKTNRLDITNRDLNITIKDEVRIKELSLESLENYCNIQCSGKGVIDKLVLGNFNMKHDILHPNNVQFDIKEKVKLDERAFDGMDRYAGCGVEIRLNSFNMWLTLTERVKELWDDLKYILYRDIPVEINRISINGDRFSLWCYNGAVIDLERTKQSVRILALEIVKETIKEMLSHHGINNATVILGDNT